MRRYQKWLAAALGMVVLTPNLTQAGILSFGEKPAPRTAAPAPAPRNQNQKVAERIRDAVKSANFQGIEIDVTVQNGAASLVGSVATNQQKQQITQLVRSVEGVTGVKNQLEVRETARREPARNAGAIQQTAGIAPARPQARPVQAQPQTSRGQIKRMNYQDDEPVQAPPSDGELPPSGPMPGTIPINPGPAPATPGAYPQGQPYGLPGSGHAGQIYDQPNFPNHAWPAYAAYPNSAAVSYPQQYSASAWPYIGPFYPYPQVPLGWRKAQLEWDDGYWKLNFRPRTDRWWWFLDYRNW